MKYLENAKILCEIDRTNDGQREKYEDELELQTIDLDYETIHSEILENIIVDQNDSGVSDFDTNDEDNNKNPKEKIFEINKIKKIIHKSVESFFSQYQEGECFKPLVQQENILNKEIINKKNDKNSKILSINDEIKNKENIEENTTDIINENKTSNNTNDIIIEKEKEIINYKKYNYFNDPYSNFNNFTKNFKIKNNIKKRFRDIHPFLKTFNPKFLKKENIDKKIFRKFRKFFKTFYKNNKNSPILSKNILFWKNFYAKNLLPPVKIEEKNGKLIDYKSFNTKYLLWLFNQEGTTELFNLFIIKERENIINNFISEYDLYESKEPDIIEKLRQYINYIPEIYDNRKKLYLEENNEIIDKEEFLKKKAKNNILEGFDSEKTISNPFNLNFDLISRKSFKELPYDNNDIYFWEGNHFNNHSYFDDKNEKFDFDNSISVIA